MEFLGSIVFVAVMCGWIKLVEWFLTKDRKGY